jgi:hypothetical protein
VPVGNGVQATLEAGVPPVWRLSAVDEFFRASSPGRTFDVSGLRFLKADGTSTTLEEARGMRNLATTLHTFPTQPPGDHQYLTGLQLRKALESLFNAQTPVNIERSSTTPPGTHRLLHNIAPAAANVFDFRLLIDGSTDPKHPNVDFRIELLSSASGVGSFRITNMHIGTDAAGGDPSNGLIDDVPESRAIVAGDADFIRTDVTTQAWQLYYRSPVHVTADGSGSIARIRFIPMLIQGRPYDFRLCFAVDGQSAAASVRFARVGCTVHDNFGTFLGKTTGLASSTPFADGQRAGAATDIDFGQLYEAD